jgi:hypothetical protein
VAHLLLRSRIADIEGFADFYAPLPVSQVVVRTLDFVPCPDLADEVIAPVTAGAYEALRSRLDAAKEALRAHGKELHYRLRQPGATRGTCTENVGRSLFVSVTGAVSPCVFTNLPLPDETATAAYCHRSFGNIHDASVGRIWRNGDYRAFRAAFRAGRVPAGCRPGASIARRRLPPERLSVLQTMPARQGTTERSSGSSPARWRSIIRR